MRLRTAVQLNAQLQGDLAWRRKELSLYRGWVRGAGSNGEQAMLRGAITVLYAHWEGYIKTASEAYLEFVRHQRLTCNELAINFVALAAKSKLNDAALSGKSRQHIDLADFFVNHLNRRAQLTSAGAINTKANLKVDVFQNIVQLLGLDYRQEYEAAEKPIIERLLELRNGIAHGEFQRIDQIEYDQLYRKIDELLVLFCNEIDNSAAQKRYHR